MKSFSFIPLILAATVLALAASHPPAVNKPANHVLAPGKHVAGPTSKQHATGSNKPGSGLSKMRGTQLPLGLRKLVLLYTASAEGQIRSCNCTKFRFGGYGRELTLLDSIRLRTPNCLLVDGGDTCGDVGFQAELKAKVSAQSMEMLKYAAMVPGEEELGLRGVRYIGDFKSKKFPLVCGNIVDSGQRPVYQPYTICKTDSGLRIGLIGLIDKSLCEPWLTVSFNQQARDPMQMLPALVKEVRPKCDLVVLVYHGAVGSDSPIAKVEGIDLVLATHRQSQDRIFPGKDSNVVTAPVSKIGGATLICSETSTNWCLGRLDIELGADRKIQSATHQLTYLDRSYEEAPAMVKIYDAYNQQVKQAVLSASAEFKKQAEALLTKRGYNLIEMRQRLHKTTYVTSAKCESCHPEISAIWQASKHSAAMHTLEATHQDYDPECIRCHTTGATARGGFSNAKDTPELANVQCEACHGAAAEHIVAPAKGFGQVTEETCRSCHTDERTPDFDYAAAWAKIMH